MKKTEYDPCGLTHWVGCGIHFGDSWKGQPEYNGQKCTCGMQAIADNKYALAFYQLGRMMVRGWKTQFLEWIDRRFLNTEARHGAKDAESD